ncbi:hypothetical protein [Streptomyces sp. NBC_00582]|uniref:hypothetical protein n=1 Tax=Streptomyces sp. NBC_00582 TaxID=2975783 RepID=UPI002E81EC51|nr:hypothetical protein [Streptomyces sp. NBC_00582]WUB59066.1 hypothetical protein OG852_00690 [Streptomyces sp. NBC_00582]WUB67662.1 hypothetical protein OG852_48445 [Streptomyces sp. NBC_00582]
MPLNVLLRVRKVTCHLADSDAKAYFAFEGTPELPIGQAAWEGFRATEGCTELPYRERCRRAGRGRDAGVVSDGRSRAARDVPYAEAPEEDGFLGHWRSGQAVWVG